MEKLAKDTHSLTHLLHQAQHPIRWSKYSKNCQATLSYTFSKSSLQMRPGSLSLFLECTHSFMIRIRPKSAHKSTLLTGDGTRQDLLNSTCKNLLPRISGLKSFTTMLPNFFRMRTMKEAPIHFDGLPLE